MTPAQVADELQLNVRTIQKWIRTGHLPAEQLGPRTTRIRRSSLDSLGSNPVMHDTEV
ncbi:helix-turn-helix domain-containing protein [Gordonia sp. OPL2]|uniref:helix-turn-helix domain-containing protein n=1 Tax=Gordonia sp. OPL2 TaxID=2486274 RepID=UPI00297408FE|nr:DNA-binding protein [Gordonia sp. OPL2]